MGDFAAAGWQPDADAARESDRRQKSQQGAADDDGCEHADYYADCEGYGEALHDAGAQLVREPEQMAHVMSVETLPSRMAGHARSNPMLMDISSVRPARSSSFMRSNMRMLASTAMPIDRNQSGDAAES